MAKYSVNNHSVDNIISWINSGEIAIPEMQRPFVWATSKVSDLMDSLYKGYPVGYLIIWKNPDVKLKDGTLSSGKFRFRPGDVVYGKIILSLESVSMPVLMGLQVQMHIFLMERMEYRKSSYFLCYRQWISLNILYLFQSVQVCRKSIEMN